MDSFFKRSQEITHPYQLCTEFSLLIQNNLEAREVLDELVQQANGDDTQLALEAIIKINIMHEAAHLMYQGIEN